VITRHVSAETMAGFRQGLLSPRRNSRISAHLAGCGRCRTLDEDLAGVRTLLAGAQPPPIPEHLAARIQTALATEAAGRVASPAGTENGIRTAAPGTERPPVTHGWRPGVPGLPRLPRLSSRVALGSLAAAAAVLVILGGMYEVFGSRGTGSGSSGTAASAPAHSSAGQSSGSEIGVPGPGGRPVSGPALQYQHSGHENSVTPVTTADMNFTPGRLRTQVAAMVARYGAGMAKALPSPLSGVRSQTATPAHQPDMFANIPVSLLQGCVDRMDAGELVLLVDVARYRGMPATIIVTDVTVIGPEQIWVVGTGCSASRSDVLTHATMAAP
jgi:hypothetical protein